MEINKLDNFLKKDNLKKKVVEQVVGRQIDSITTMINELLDSNNKPSKLYKLTKEISKIIDLYDEETKIDLNREEFIKEYKDNISPFFTEKEKRNFSEIIDLLIHETVKYDPSNWISIYDNILKSIDPETSEIDLNQLYNLNPETLIPERLIGSLKSEQNEMIDGGFFTFQSFTQEMLGLINEYVTINGGKTTKKYLSQGEKEKYKIKELLKEVNAASILEAFKIDEKTGEPTFTRARTGQLDGLLIQNNQVKIILATKDENTAIERDSILRHFITGLLIKKKIDEIKPTEKTLLEKKQFWINYYNNEDSLNKIVRNIKEQNANDKKGLKKILSSKDYYVSEEFLEKFKSTIEDGKARGLKELTVQLKQPISVNGKLEKIALLDMKLAEKILRIPNKNSKSGSIKLSLEEAERKLPFFKHIIAEQKEMKEKLKSSTLIKLEKQRFKEQIELDCKKETMVNNSEFTSLKEMISHYNRNPNEVLQELGILPSNNRADKLKIIDLSIEEMDKLIDLSKELNADLVYYGSVSSKKQAQEYHYNKDEEYLKNKEYRFGLNVLAYSNVLSDTVKDGFKISTDAALSFVENIKLRAITRASKNGLDLDLNKVNKTSFIKEVIHVTFKNIFEKKEIENDSIDFYENLFNATNTIISDIQTEVNDYLKDREEDPTLKMLSHKEMFNQSIQRLAGTEDQNINYDAVKILTTIKEISILKSDKFVHGNSIIEALNSKIDGFIKSSNDPELLEILEKFKTKRKRRVRNYK